MLWIKRLLPFVIIIGGWFGYDYYINQQLVKQQILEEKYASVTALVWVASAKYRTDPEQFTHYRDSVLNVYNTDNQKVEQYIKQFEKSPEAMGPLTNLIKVKIDSLLIIEDSLRLNSTPASNDTTDIDIK